MFFSRIYSHFSRTILPFVGGVKNPTFTKSAPQAFVSLSQALTAPRSSKLPRAFLVPGSRFFQSHAITKASFPQHQQSDFRLLGVLAAVGLLAASKKVGCSQGFDEVNLDDLSEEISKSLDALKALRETEPVLFIGATDSGKSTTLNVMMGFPVQILEVDSLGAATLKVDHPDAFKIGNTKSSETEVVKAKQEPDSKMWLTDCPGYHDNRSRMRQFVSDISSYLATQTVRKVKAIVVTISIGAFEQKGKSFKDVALTLHDFITNGAAAKESIFFVFTRSQIRETSDWRGNKKYQVYPVEKSEVIQHIRDIFKAIKDKPEKDQTKEDKAIRHVIELMLGDEIEEDGSNEHRERNSLDSGRIFVIDISNGNQRKVILDAIAKAPGIEKDQFNPKITGAVGESFKKSIIHRLELGSQVKEMFALRDQESDLKLIIEGTHTEISRIDDQIEHLRKGAPLDVTQYSEVVVDKIHNYKEIETLLNETRKRIQADIQVNDTVELVEYWKDRFFSEAPFLDFFSRTHIFHAKLGRPFSKVHLAERTERGVVWEILEDLAAFQSQIPTIPTRYVLPNGENRVITCNKDTGEYKSEYRVIRQGVTADVTVTIEGPKNGREDVARLLTTLRRDLQQIETRLDKLATEKKQAEEALKNVTALCSSLAALTAQKSNLGIKVSSHQEELRVLQNKLAVIESDIRKNQEALNTVLDLVQFDLIRNILGLNQDLISNFTETMTKLHEDPKFQKK